MVPNRLFTAQRQLSTGRPALQRPHVGLVKPCLPVRHIRAAGQSKKGGILGPVRTQCKPSDSDSNESNTFNDIEEDFDALSNRVAELTTQLNNELRGCSIYLVGMMGSGKSSVGKMLANTMRYAFFDTDVMIEAVHEGRKTTDIFEEFGEEYFRNCETQVLKQLAPYKNLIIATGGGAVLKPMNWSHMQQGVVAWLKGDTLLLARRVVKDGVEKRPLLLSKSQDAGLDVEQSTKAKLDAILSERTKFYENADVIVHLDGQGKNAMDGATTAVVMYRVMEAILKKVSDTKAERDVKRNFKIEKVSHAPPTHAE